MFERSSRQSRQGHDPCRQIIVSKLEILKTDPTEKHFGVVLEYGHTFAHAIE